MILKKKKMATMVAIFDIKYFNVYPFSCQKLL